MFCLLCKNDNNSWIAYHSKPNICFFESRSVICPIACYCNHLPLVCHSAVNNACQIHIQENMQNNISINKVNIFFISLSVSKRNHCYFPLNYLSQVYAYQLGRIWPELWVWAILCQCVLVLPGSTDRYCMHSLFKIVRGVPSRFLSINLFSSIFATHPAAVVPLLSHYESSCWTPCHRCRGSLLLDGWCHTW